VSKFEKTSAGVAAALRSGLALEVAAEAKGVSPTTVRGWLRKGQREPDSEFGAFLRSATPPADGDGPMTAAEVERHLVTVIREKKSVTAMALWLRLHGQDQTPAGDDPLAAFLPAGSSNGRG
jgi:hypothetical protein